MSDGLMTAVLLLAPHDESNAGYQAAAALERELRLEGLEIVIARKDHGDGNGYWLAHQKAEGGHDYWEFDEQVSPCRSLQRLRRPTEPGQCAGLFYALNQKSEFYIRNQIQGLITLSTAMAPIAAAPAWKFRPAP